MTNNKQKLTIFDTTLRDGEQSPGVTLSADEKVEIARHLSRMRVDVCEAGFPVASPGDFDAVVRIAKEVGGLMDGRGTDEGGTGKPMIIAALARAVSSDIQRAYDAVKHAPLHRIHTFLATSDLHLLHKLKISREECVKRAVAAVSFAKSIGFTDIEFSPEDAGRSEKEFLCKVLGEVIAAGATTLNIPDTVGYNTPEEYGALMKHLIKNTPGAEKVTWSCHCHNDLGLATANTLAGVTNGARQVEVTINGIGERAGNTSLEEIVMVLYTHPDTYPVYSNIDPKCIYPISQLVTRLTGMMIQPNKAIVGGNAFAHESGIHQDGVLKFKGTYEIIAPEIVGITANNNLVLGKHSGRNAFRTRVEYLLKQSDSSHPPHVLAKLTSDKKAFESLFEQFKKLADTKKRIGDVDLMALVDEHFGVARAGLIETYVLQSVQVVSGTNVLSTATVSLIDKTSAIAITSSTTTEDREPKSPMSPTTSFPTLTDAAIGYGPVHAIFGAINRLVGTTNVLAFYSVSAVTEGSDALGRVMVRIHEADVEENHDAVNDMMDVSEYETPASAIQQQQQRASKAPKLLHGDSAPTSVNESTSTTKNNDSPSKTTPHPKAPKAMFVGQGTDEDILVASARAYLNAINRMLDYKRKQKKAMIVNGGGVGGDVSRVVLVAKNVDV